MFAYTLASKPCSEATNKDYFISRGRLLACGKSEVLDFVGEVC